MLGRRETRREPAGVVHAVAQFSGSGAELKMDKERAEKHWEYTESIIRLMFELMLKLTHLAYVAGMLHGAKHERDKKGKED